MQNYINDVDLNDLTKIYKTTKYGDMRIISILDKKQNGHIVVNVEFLDTGTIKTARIDHVKEGIVKDDMKGISFDKEYDSVKYGKFKILKLFKESRTAEIQFINTGSIRTARIDHVLSGSVADLSIKPVHGVAEYGNCDINYNEYKWLYNIWIGMISRCYNKNNMTYESYGGIGVKVCERWLTYANFVNDVKYLYGYDKKIMYPYDYQLDKDYLQYNIPKNERIYSPETCIFLHKNDNHNLMLIQNFGNTYIGINCINNDLYMVKIYLYNTIQYAYFNNLLAAQNAYNYFYLKYMHNYELVPYINDCYHMPFDQFMKYNVNDVIFAKVI